MEYLRWLFGLSPSMHNSTTEDELQTHTTAAGTNQAGETFFGGVRDITVDKATFIQNIHGGKVVDPIKANIIAYYIPQTQVLLDLMA